MTPEIGFTTFFLVTVLFLGAALVMGLKARRKAHLSFVGLMLVALAVAVYYAKELGKVYDLEAAGWITPVHLTMAKVLTVALILPVASGIATIRDARRIAWHRSIAWFMVVFIVATAITGVWMISLAERIPAAEARPAGVQAGERLPD